MSIDDFLKRTHDGLNSDLRFAEAKNTALITFNSAMIGLTSKALFEHKHTCCVVNFMTAISLLLLLIPVVISLLSICATEKPRKGQRNAVEGTKASNEESDESESCNGGKENKTTDNPSRYAYYDYIFQEFPACSIESHSEYLKKLAGDNYDKYTSLPNLQTARQIVDLAGICHRKFNLFNLAIKIEFAAIAVWGTSAFLSVVLS